MSTDQVDDNSGGGLPSLETWVSTLRRRCELEDEVEQLRVQLAGCLTAAEGHGVAVGECAVAGDYGWSLAYQKVLELRRRHDSLEEKLGRLDC